MNKLRMIAGRLVTDAAGGEHVGAYVVLAAGRMTRIFVVRGATASPTLRELDAATTIDLRRFEAELETELPSGSSPAKRPADPWACGVVRDYLLRTEGLDVS